MHSVFGIMPFDRSLCFCERRREHHAKSRHVIVRPSQAVVPSYATPGGVRIYRDDSVPGGLRTDHDDPPAYDDPSKFGSG